MNPAFTFKVYDFTVPAGGVYRLPVTGAYFRIMTATGAVNVTVEGVGTLPALLAGQALKGLPFGALILQDASGAPNAGQILVASSEFQDNRLNGTVDLSSASLAALESVDLNAATISQLADEKAYGATFFSSIASTSANTPVTVFTAAANVNGCRLHSACLRGGNSSYVVGAILAKSGAVPTSVTDGDDIGKGASFYTAGSNPTSFCETAEGIFIPAGKGLFFITSAASVGKMNARYTLL